MTKLLQELTQFFAKEPSILEQFINSKNPKSHAELEYWIRHFEQKGV